MYCPTEGKDYTLRTQVSESGKVHAANERIRNNKAVLYTACNRYKYEYAENGYFQNMIEPNATITCKKCLAKLEFEPESEPKRFVVYRRDMDMYYKKSSSRGTMWSPYLHEAYIFKVVGAAKSSTYRLQGVHIDIKEVTITIKDSN